MHLVLVQSGVVWTRAKHLGQLTARGPTEEIHLPEAVGSGGVALSEVEVLIVLRFNVRNAAFVAMDRYASFDSLYLDRVLLSSRVTCETKEDEKQNCKAWHKLVSFRAKEYRISWTGFTRFARLTGFIFVNPLILS